MVQIKVGDMAAMAVQIMTMDSQGLVILRMEVSVMIPAIWEPGTDLNIGAFMGSNITGSNRHPATYGHSNYISKRLGFGQSHRHYYYE